jgi:hypothetical protein
MGHEAEEGARHTLKKYKSLCSLLSAFICPLNTKVKQMKPATTNAIGVKIHAKRPSLPMLAIPNVLSYLEAYSPRQGQRPVTIEKLPRSTD